MVGRLLSTVQFFRVFICNSIYRALMTTAQINAIRKYANQVKETHGNSKSGLKPILFMVTPINSENRKLAIHAAEPRISARLLSGSVERLHHRMLSMQEMI